MTVVGETTLGDLREELDDPVFDHEDVVTIAGLVLAHAGVVPDVGHTVRHGRYDLTVEDLDGRRITLVRIRAGEGAVNEA